MSLSLKCTYIFLCLSISAFLSSSSFLCFSSKAFLLLSVLPKISMRSGGEAALSLRDEVVVDRERERESLRRFLFDSRDLDRFFDLSLSLDLDRDRLRFLLCLLLFECLDRDELRLRERPMSTTCTRRPLRPNCCVLWLIYERYLEFRSTCFSLNSLFIISDQMDLIQRVCF